MKFELDTDRRNISDDDILNDLRTVSVAVEQKTLTYKEYKQHGGKFSDKLIIKRFGSWTCALTKSGLVLSSMQIGKISSYELLQDLRRVSEKLSRNFVSTDDYIKYGLYHISTLRNRFKTLSNALSEAGLEQVPSVNKKKNSDEELIQEMKYVFEMLGKNFMTRVDYDNHIPKPKFSAATIRKRFNGWSAALEKADLPSVPHKSTQIKIPRDMLLKDLIYIANNLGAKTIKVHEYLNAGGKYSQVTFHREFGSWNNALVEARLSKSTNRGLSDIEIFREILKKWEELGRQPRYDECKAFVSVCCSRFGSWRKAFRSVYCMG
jgi:hypothetical protein